MSDSPKKPTKCCEHCRGTGRVELTGVYYETWLKLSECKRPVTSTDMSALVGCSYTAMNGRLSNLERLGLAASERYGPLRLFWAVNPDAPAPDSGLAAVPENGTDNANRT